MDSIISKYSTVSLVDSLNSTHLDFDPSLNSQECLPSWLNSLIIEKDSASNNNYNVSYLDGYNADRIRIKLTVVEVGNEYKIDKIKY